MDKRRRQLLDAILLSVSRADLRAVDVPLTGFAAMQGRHCHDGLTVVGRAVNGWTNSWTVMDLRDPEKRGEILSAIESSVEIPTGGADCPMAWVVQHWGDEADYNTARSAFWRCIRRVLTNLEIAAPDARDWSSRLVWTNLYKVAPASGGNPPGDLANAQHDACRALLHAEIEESCTRRVLFLTGLEWTYAFLPDLTDAVFSETFDSDVSLSGRMHAANGSTVSMVVASHPQGKPEDQWTTQVLEAFQRLGGAEQSAATARPPATRSAGG